MASKKILILGAGAIGSNLTRFLTADLREQHEITVLDRDLVEERNVIPGTQFYTSDDIGSPKVEALQFNIHRYHGQEIKILHSEFSDIDGLGVCGYNLIVDCFDNSQSRQAVSNAYRHCGIFRTGSPRLCHVGFSEQFTFAIEWDRNYTTPGDISFDICEHPGASSFVNFVSSTASWVLQEYLKTGTFIGVIGNTKYIRTFNDGRRIGKRA